MSNITPSATMVDRYEDLKLGAVSLDEHLPTSPSDTARFSARTASPATPLPVMQLRRANPKRLSLSVAVPTASHFTPLVTGSTNCPSPPSFDVSSKDSTPYTPGPPQTPILALSMGRVPSKGYRRGSLLSLITQPPTNDAPPTPSAHPYATNRVAPRIRTRSGTSDTIHHVDVDRGSKSAYPAGFSSIREHDRDDLGSLSHALPISTPRVTSSSGTSPSSSIIASSSSTPSSSPPLPTLTTFPTEFPSRPTEPYADGPIEVLPNVFLGAEDSYSAFQVWGKGRTRLRVLNVAQEVEDPFAEESQNGSGSSREKVKLATYRQGDLDWEYCHLRWSHGETGLAELPAGASLAGLIGKEKGRQRDSWGFWEAIEWMEEGRKEGVPTLIHCQCGVSRSATLAIAYVMALAALGVMHETLGHLRGMQDAYDFVKNKSSWIGPNVSLVFQLVEFARNLTSLLSSHDHTAHPIETSWPLAEAVMSDEEWARRREAFDEDEAESAESLGSPEEAEGEARMLDEKMRERQRWK